MQSSPYGDVRGPMRHALSKSILEGAHVRCRCGSELCRVPQGTLHLVRPGELLAAVSSDDPEQLRKRRERAARDAHKEAKYQRGEEAAQAKLEKWRQKKVLRRARKAVEREAHEAPRFRLDEAFLQPYKALEPEFGFDGVGDFTYMRSYCRDLKDPKTGLSRYEVWWETVRRVTEGTLNLALRHLHQHHLPANLGQLRLQAERMYDRMFHMKFLPPGRGLLCMGSSLTEEKHVYASLNNCAFVSTKPVEREEESGGGGEDDLDPVRPFIFLMDMEMLGVGVGFDTKAAGRVQVHEPVRLRNVRHLYEIPDSREGWVESVNLLLTSYLHEKMPAVDFTYDLIRKEGQPLRGFGGFASGPGVLKELHDGIRSVLSALAGKSLSITAVADLGNLIGRCVVAGGVRRSSEIVFGPEASQEFLDLKNLKVNPQRAGWYWASNNSIYAQLGQSYKEACQRIVSNGEPGFAWLHNMRRFSRMRADEADGKDHRAQGANPCAEQTLESYELCCLVETFPVRHVTLDDYLETVRAAMFYAGVVTLGHTHWPATNAVLLRNRRIGCSVSGQAEFRDTRGLQTMRNWLLRGYEVARQTNAETAELFCTRASIKITCVKPSGSVSLLAGATPGVHWPESRYYIRRVRFSAKGWHADALRGHGYHVEPDVTDPTNTLVVEFPVAMRNADRVRVASEVSLWEKMEFAAVHQEDWADNAVSCTASFNKRTEAGLLEAAVDHFQYRMKGIAFLPADYEGSGGPAPYPQMPYQDISEEQYHVMRAKIRRGAIDWNEPLRRHQARMAAELATKTQEKDAAAASLLELFGQPCVESPRPELFCTNPGCS